MTNTTDKPFGRPYVRAGYTTDANATQKRIAKRMERETDIGWAERYYRADGLLEIRIMNVSGIITAIKIIAKDGTITDLD